MNDVDSPPRGWSSRRERHRGRTRGVAVTPNLWVAFLDDDTYARSNLAGGPGPRAAGIGHVAVVTARLAIRGGRPH